nr:hypothetical protein [Tanacetum cinerariifolium]
DNESLSDEEVTEDNVKIYSNPLFKFNDEYISSHVNPFFDKVIEDIECKDSYDFNLDDSTFLVTPLSDVNEDEYLAPGDDIELLLYRDPSTPMMSVDSILEGFTDEPPLERNDDLFDLKSKKNEWKKILYDSPIDDLITEDNVFNPEIHDNFFSPTYVSLPFTDRPNLFFTYVVQILLLYFTYLVVSPFLLSSRSEYTIFDIGIFAFQFSHQSGTFISFNVYPNILNEKIPYDEINVHIKVLSVLWGNRLPVPDGSLPLFSGNSPSCRIVGAENEFVHDPNPFPYDNTPEFYDQLPQHHVKTYSCELGDVDKINAFDIPSDFEDSYYDSEGDVLYLESLLSDDTTPNLPPESLFSRAGGISSEWNFHVL